MIIMIIMMIMMIITIMMATIVISSSLSFVNRMTALTPVVLIATENRRGKCLKTRNSHITHGPSRQKAKPGG